MSFRKVTAALFACVMLASCASDDTAKPAETKPLRPFAPLCDIAEDRKNIYVIIKNVDSSYWQVVIDGAGRGGTDFACNVYGTGTYQETDWQGQAQLIDDALNAGADALIIAPNDSVKLAEKIEQVYAAGIPVILADTTANTDSYDICYMTDNLRAGQQGAEELLSQLRNAGHTEDEYLEVGLQVGATTSQTINERIAGFCSFWTQNAPENWKMITDIKFNEGDIDKAVTCAEELMDEYPNIKGLFATNNGSTVGFARVVKERHRTDLVLVGFDYSDEIAELIHSGEYTVSTVLQMQSQMSYLGVKSAMDILDGDKPGIKFYDTGVVVVNRDNLNEPDVIKAIGQN